MLQLPMALPTLHLKGRSLQSVLRRQGGRHGAYTTTATSLPQAVGLVPYHRIAHERYNLYWQVA